MPFQKAPCLLTCTSFLKYALFNVTLPEKSQNVFKINGRGITVMNADIICEFLDEPFYIRLKLSDK